MLTHLIADCAVAGTAGGPPAFRIHWFETAGVYAPSSFASMRWRVPNRTTPRNLSRSRGV